MNGQRKISKGTMAMGLILMALGAAMLMQNMELIDIGSVWSYWPLGFVVVGLVTIANASHRKQVGEGAWWIFFGLWLYVSLRHVWGLGFGETWPALIVAWGVSLIWNSTFNAPVRTAKEC